MIRCDHSSFQLPAVPDTHSPSTCLFLVWPLPFPSYHGTRYWLVTAVSPPSQQMWLQQCPGHQRGRHSLFDTFLTHRVRADPSNRQFVLFFFFSAWTWEIFFLFSSLPRWRCPHSWDACGKQPHLCVYNKVTGIPGIKTQQKPGERGSGKSVASQPACPCVLGLSALLCRTMQMKGGLGDRRTVVPSLPAPNPYFWSWQRALTGLQDDETCSSRWGTIWTKV